jgi:hypothetical protein
MKKLFKIFITIYLTKIPAISYLHNQTVLFTQTNSINTLIQENGPAGQ